MMQEQPRENEARDFRTTHMRAHAGRMNWEFRFPKELRNKRDYSLERGRMITSDSVPFGALFLESPQLLSNFYAPLPVRAWQS
jgi:hypothetical protein